ncbi:hypothetical protein T06_4075 [Trichinella sp. T6]|nr:hypothetical protein T06_4075 [Trichinella sp. T6]
MFFDSLAKYDDIVQVHQAVGAHQASQECLHEPLKGGRCVAQSKGHHFELVQPKGGGECRLLPILLFDLNLPGECVRVFAGHLRRLFAKAFPEMSESADKILLQQFKAGLSAEAVKTAVLRSEMDNLAEAVEVAVKEERVVRELTKLEARVASVKTVLELLDPTARRFTEATAAAELLTDNTLAGTKRPPPGQRRGPEKRGDRRCRKCGGLGHISREYEASSRDARASEIETPIVEGSVGGVGCNMLIDTESAVTLVDERFMRHSKTMRAVLKPLIRLETPSWDRIGNHERVRHGDCTWEISDRSAFRSSHAVAPVRAESPQSELIAHQPAHEAMEKMLSNGDHGRTGVVRHAIYTGDAKPVRIAGPEWVRPPEVLTMVSNVEIWFEHMELYFRAGRIAPERRAALVQYHTDAEVRSIMRAMDVQETDDYDGLKSALFEAFGVRTGPERLFSKAFPEMSGSADKILLQQFKAGLSAEAVKTAVLRSEMDNFAEEVEVAVTDKRVVRELTTLEERVASLKTDAHQEDEPTAGRVTESAAAAVRTRKEVGDD